MLKFELEEFKRLAGERSKGEWQVDPWIPGKELIRCKNGYTVSVKKIDGIKHIVPEHTHLSDAQFIAYVGTHADQIIARLEEQELNEQLAVALNEQLHKENEKLEKVVGVARKMSEDVEVGDGSDFDRWTALFKELRKVLAEERGE